MPTIHLQFIDGPLQDATFTFDCPTIRIGRDDANDVCVENDLGVSGSHATITLEDGAWYLDDCGSTNGTFLKSSEIAERIRNKTRLISGQCIKLGRSQILVTMDAVDEDTVIVQPADEAPQAVDHQQAGAKPGDGITQQPRRFLRVDLAGDELRYELASLGAIGARSTTAYNAADIAQLRESIFDLAFRSRQNAASNPVSTSRKFDDALLETGTMLGHMLFPKRIQAALADASGPSLILIHTAPLVSVPWELAVVDGEFIGARHAFGRQVMLDQHSSILDHARVSQLPIQRPRLLIVCNPTGDLVELEAETDQLLDRLHSANTGWQIEYFARERVARLDLLARLAKADFVYYVGHAEHDVDAPEKSGWLLQDGRLTCQDIRRLPQAPIAVLANGCETGREADWNEDESLRDHAFGVASAFLLSGASCYIGAVWPIGPRPAATFARTFFEQLADGELVGECVRGARAETRETSGADLTWAAYVMYGDPAAQLIAPMKGSG